MRLALLWLVLGAPFVVAAAIEGVTIGRIAIVLALIGAYLMFWIRRHAVTRRQNLHEADKLPTGR